MPIQDKKWLDTLKTGIINEDTYCLSKVIKEIPVFKNLENATTALALVNSAKTIIINKQNKLRLDMKKIKQMKEFLK